MSNSRPSTAAGSAPVAAALNRTFSPASNVNVQGNAYPSANANGNNKVIYMPWTNKDEVNEVTKTNTHIVADIIKRIGRRFATVGGIGKSLSKQSDNNRNGGSRRYYFTGGMNKYDTFKSYNGGSFAGPNVYIEGVAKKTTLKDEINKACLLLGNFARCNYDVTRFQLKFALENRLRMKISDRSIDKIFSVFDPFITGTIKLRKLVKVVILNSVEGFESELEWLYVRGQGDTYPPPISYSAALNNTHFDTGNISNSNNNGNCNYNESEKFLDGFGTVQLFASPKSTTLQRPRTASAASASPRGAPISSDVCSIDGSNSNNNSNNNKNSNNNSDENNQLSNSNSSNTNSKPSSSTASRPRSAPLYRPSRTSDRVAINSDALLGVEHSLQQALAAVVPNSTLNVLTLTLSQPSSSPSTSSISPHKPSSPRPLSASASPRKQQVAPTSPLATANYTANTTTTDSKAGKNDIASSYFLSNAQISYKDWSAIAASVDKNPSSHSATAAAMTSRSNPEDCISSHVPTFTYTGQKPTKLVDPHAPLLQAKYKFFRYRKRPTEQNDYGYFAKSYSHVQKTRDRMVTKVKGATTTIDLNSMMRDV